MIKILSAPASLYHRSSSIPLSTLDSPNVSLNSKGTGNRRKHRATAPSTPGGDMAPVGDTAVQCLLTRFETADQKGDRRYTRLAGALKYITTEVQNLSESLSKMKDDLATIRASTVVTSMGDLAMFPLQKKEDVFEYVEKEPDMRQLMER